MKKTTAYIAVSVLTVLLVGVAAVSTAQTSVESDASASVNTGGGLGKGLNHMVRNILGEDTDESVSFPAQAPAAARMMMQTNTAADRGVPAPESMMMSVNAELTEQAGVTAVSEEELHSHIHDLIVSDSRIQSIDSSDTHVRVTYAVPSKVLKFVRVNLRVTVGAYASHRVEVSYPWYAFAATGLSQAFKADVTSRVELLTHPSPFSLDQQKLLVDEIHLALAAAFGSSTNGDN